MTTVLLALCLLAGPGESRGPEPVASPGTGVVLKVEGLAERPLSLSLEDLARMPRSAGEGPLRLVVPQEKRQGRWVRQVIVLRVVQANP